MVDLFNIENILIDSKHHKNTNASYIVIIITSFKTELSRMDVRYLVTFTDNYKGTKINYCNYIDDRSIIKK